MKNKKLELIGALAALEQAQNRFRDAIGSDPEGEHDRYRASWVEMLNESICDLVEATNAVIDAGVANWETIIKKAPSLPRLALATPNTGDAR